MTVTFRDATPDELEGWDELTVRPAGGHVLQSRAWAEHRATKGWRPRHLVGDDGSAVLALTRSWPIVGGGSAYLPRGPVPTADLDAAVSRLDGATRFLAADGVDVVAADAEVQAPGYADRIAALGFKPIEEIQPSRHRLSLSLGSGADEEAALANASKSTRQRIRKAEASGLSIIRHDPAADEGSQQPGAYGDFVVPREAAGTAFERFHELASMTADRRDFALGSRASFLDWTTRAWGSGLVVLLLGVDEDGGEQAPVAGLMLYRHGGRLSTALSGDRPDARDRHPGAFHLLRWRAIQLAIREDASEMDLGGVDVAGSRHEPKEGEPMFGLYQHKRSFGAEWVELPGAHEKVVRPLRYLAGRVAGRVIRR
jgi:lipid II:glycine glycyltransferase (peptidoglycan interpeptide bridge formation enzyme)